MARPRTTDPKLYWIASEGAWAVTISGVRHRLGSDQAAAELRRQALVGEWLLRGRSPRPRADGTVADVTTSYYATCTARHEAGDLDGAHLDRIAYAVEVVQRLYGDTPAAAFGPKKLETVRSHLVTCRSRRGKAPVDSRPLLSRRYVNHLIGCLQTCWEWAVRQELVPPAAAHGLRSVKALRRKEGGRELPPRLPVPPDVVEATLPFCGAILSAMIRVQRLAGMRPQDVCGMARGLISTAPNEVLRPIPSLPVSAFPDPETGVLLWVYCPAGHKTEKLDRPRIVVLGPAAQAVLAPFLVRPPAAPLFSPRESEAARRPPGGRAKRRPGRKPGDAYTTQSYGRAIIAAVRRANLASVTVPHWTPHQLRHDAATAATVTAGEHVAAALVGDNATLMTTYAWRAQMRQAGTYAAVHG
jgi:integrase